MQWLSDKLDNILTWLLALVTDVFNTVTGWLHDFLIWTLDTTLQAIATIISAIPIPSFMSSGGLSSLYGGLDPGLQYLLNVTGFAQALAILGAGVTFRLLRKFATLFQW